MGAMHDGLSMAMVVQIEIVSKDTGAGVFEIAYALCVCLNDK